MEQSPNRASGALPEPATEPTGDRSHEGIEARFQELLEATPDAMMMVDAHGCIRLVNRQLERLFGYERSELLGEPIETLVPLRFRSLHAEQRIAYSKCPHTRPMAAGIELHGLRKDGTEFPAEISLTPVHTPCGTFITGAIRDVTERKLAAQQRLELEARIQHAQKLESLGVLAGGIAHDFNNLLVSVVGNVGLALRQIPPESPVRSYLRSIEATAERAAELTNQMLAYSGKGKFRVEAVSVNRLVQEMTHLLQVSIAKNVVLRFELSTSLPPVEADATQLRQVIMNLITNASDAIGTRSGVIALRTGAFDARREYLAATYLDENLAEGLYVYLEVSDNGCGMDRSTRERIFDPFFTTKFAGRGLGLAAVLGIVRGHRGAIKVYSEPGRGTTFKLLLPASPGAVLSEAPEVSPTDPAWRGHGKVLVIDDEDTVRATTAEMLSTLGFEVLTAPDGREGLSLFEQHLDEIAFVLLDMTMPHMAGDEAFARLRALSPAVKVVLISGYNEQDVTAAFSGKGLSGFLQKPYSLKSLTRLAQSLAP